MKAILQSLKHWSTRSVDVSAIKRSSCPKTLDYDSDVSEVEHPRLQVCQALSLERLPCSIWGEDALAHHGVPTLVFDVFLLVHDPEKSAQALIELCFERTAANPRFKRMPPLSAEAPRLAIPVPGDHSFMQDETNWSQIGKLGLSFSQHTDGDTMFPTHAKTKFMSSLPECGTISIA